MSELERLVELIDRLVSEAEACLGEQPDWLTDRGGYHRHEGQRRLELEAIQKRLTEQEAARFTKKPGYESAVRLAGIRASCTGGEWGALRNWQNAARRKIEAGAAS